MHETPQPKGASPDRYVHIRKRTIRLVLAVLIGVPLLLLITHPLLLTALARFLILDQEIQLVDAILVLGGGAGGREEWGAELYLAGHAPRIIVSGEKPHTPGEERSFAEISSQYLQALGIPEQVILLMPETTSTFDEAVTSLAILKEIGASSMIVISDPYHLRRASWTFRRIYAGEDVDLTFSATPYSWFSVARWWTRERDLMAVIQEYEKLLFYLLAGRLL